MERPLIMAVLLVMGCTLGWLLIGPFGPPEADALPEPVYAHDPVTRLLHLPASELSPPPRDRNASGTSARGRA